jgi:hypothetical protein
MKEYACTWAFLISKRCKCQRSALRFGSLSAGKAPKVSGHWIRGSVGPYSQLESSGEEKIPTPYRNRTSVVPPVVSHCANPAYHRIITIYNVPTTTPATQRPTGDHSFTMAYFQTSKLHKMRMHGVPPCRCSFGS